MTLHFPLLLTYLLAIALLIATPGPVVMLVAGTAANRGARQGLLTAVGTNAASLVLIFLAALMVFGVVMIDARLLTAVQIGGCLFVAVLALRTLRDEWRQDAASASTGAGVLPAAKRKRLPAVVTGFLVGIANPKDILFFVAFFPQFIAVTSEPRASLGILTAIWIVVDFTILIAYITVLSQPAMQRQQRWISMASASLLLVVAVIGLIRTV